MVMNTLCGSVADFFFFWKESGGLDLVCLVFDVGLESVGWLESVGEAEHWTQDFEACSSRQGSVHP